MVQPSELLQPGTGVNVDLYRSLVEMSTDLIVMVDAEGTIAFANDASLEVLGYEPEEMLGRHFSAFVAPESQSAAEAYFDEEKDGNAHARQHIVGLRRGGEHVHLRFNSTPLIDSDGEFHGSVAIVCDVSRQKAHDRERELAQLVRDNEMILRSAGDGIFRLDPQMRITYANPAAGEILDCSHIELMGRNAHELLHHSYADGSPYPIEDCPIGASLRGEVTHRADEVFWRPNGTPFPVKYTSAPIRENGRVVGAVCVFADITDQKEREEELREQLEWERRITRAVEGDSLLVHSQPVVDLRSGEPVQEELLVRMRGERGADDIVPPGEFLPEAERLDLIQAIDRWMLVRAIELIARGRTVEVNISARSLADQGLLDDIRRAARDPRVDASRLIFEITETAAAENADAARRFAEKLERMGCRLALDDFGTGFGAMTYLKSVAAHFLKIDIEFVRGVARNPGDRRIVRTIVDIAQRHGQRTIAEGVEDAETAEVLRQMGVDYAQGFHFGRPAPID
jgi:PAS domain S-box-containing protein